MLPENRIKTGLNCLIPEKQDSIKNPETRWGIVRSDRNSVKITRSERFTKKRPVPLMPIFSGCPRLPVPLQRANISDIGIHGFSPHLIRSLVDDIVVDHKTICIR